MNLACRFCKDFSGKNVVRVLGIIPARAGSVRLPDKNKLSLGGLPLIQHTISQASNSQVFENILVSTDDEDIKNICPPTVLTPWLRPAELSQADSSSVDVVLHALCWYEETVGEVDAVMLLQPTSPFRTIKSITEAVEIFEQNPSLPVVSVSKFKVQDSWIMNIGESGLIFPEITKSDKHQNAKTRFVLTGSIYLCPVSLLKKERALVHEKNVPLIIESFKENLDIDTQDDFDLAQTLITKHGA